LASTQHGPDGGLQTVKHHASGLNHSFSHLAAVEGSEQQWLGAFRKVRGELRAYLRDFQQSG